MWPFRLLLRFYPPPFRRLYAHQLEADFADLLERSRRSGRWAVLGLWLRVAGDMVRTGLSERWSGRAYRAHAGTRGRGALRVPHRGLALVLGDAVQDLRVAVRSLRRAPGYVSAVLITLALGIGANTALFSVAYGTLLRPLPFESGDRLVRLIHDAPSRVESDDAWVRVGFSVSDLTAYAERLPGLEEVSEYHTMTFTLIDQEGPHRVRAGVVSANYFEFLGLEPLHGRLLRPAEDHLGAEPVVVLAHDYWQQRFGGDPGIVGRRVRMNDRTHEIVGVLPPGPQFPIEGELFLPLSACPTRSDPAFIADPEARMMFAYGRLEAGVDVETLAARADSLLGVLAGENPEAYAGRAGLDVHAVLLRDDMVAGLRPTTAALLALAGLVWLIACANASGLALARSGRRLQELELRSALGAGRGRLVRTLLTESVTLGIVGGLLGLAVAWAGHGLLVEFAGRFTTRAQEIRLDGAVLLFGAATSLLAGLIFGAVPGMWVGRRHRIALGAPQDLALGVRGRALQRSLVVAQVAVAFAVVTAAGLSVRTAWAVDRTELGFETRAVAGFAVPLDQHRWHSADSARHMFARITTRVASLPAVQSAVRVAGRPLAGEQRREMYRLDEAGPAGSPWAALSRVVDPGFFELLGLRIVEGRGFVERDAPQAPPVAVVNRTFHERFLQPHGAVGTRLVRCPGPATCLPPLTVVGVVDDVRLDGADREVEPEVYEVARQVMDYGGEHVVLGFEGPAHEVEAAVIEAVRAVEPTLAVSNFTSLDALRHESIRPRRFLAALLGFLGAVAVGLAVTGLFGVATLSAGSRRRELGLRCALGATPRGLVWLVLAEGLWIASAGIGVGVLVAWAFGAAFSRFFEAVLWGVAPYDLATWALSAAGLVVVAAVAAGIPARRASRVDVVEVLQGR